MSEKTELALVLKQLDSMERKLSDLQPAGVPRALTMKEVAESMGWSLDTVRRLCDRRELRYIQSGPSTAKRILVTDLNDWIRKNSVDPVA